jgi:hypothetical protein
MPTVMQLTTVAGKYGFVEIAGTRVPFSRWELSLAGNYLPRNNFNRFPFGVVGIVGGELTLAGPVNTAAGGNYAQPPLSLRIRDEPYLITLGLTPTLFLPPIRVAIFAGPRLVVDVDGAEDLEYRGQIQGAANEIDPHFYPGDSPL